MSPNTPAPLAVAEIELKLDSSWFPFTTTAEAEPLAGLVAQPRAVRALELSLGVPGAGYNVFALGLSGTNLPRILQKFVEERLAGRPTPPDWVYVNNFDEPDRPLALALPAGQAGEFKRQMRELPFRLAQLLPRAMQYQGFNQEKERLQRDCNQQCEELFQQLRELARQRDLHVEVNEEGNLVFAPLREMQPLTLEEIGQLSPDEIAQFYEKQMDVLREGQPIFEQQQSTVQRMQEALQNIERTFADALLTSVFDPLWTKYTTPGIRDWLDRVKQHVLDNVTQFLNAFSQGPPQAEEGEEGPPAGAPLSPLPLGLDYDVNVVVDNSNRQGPPVLVEDVPTYKNLFGFVERLMDLNGRIVTHFTQIKAGTLLRGHGGVVIFNLDDAIDEPQVWKEIKRTLKNRRAQIDSSDTNIPLGASALKPQAIPLDVKLIVVGSMNLFYALSCLDPEFSELFKVKAEFADEVPLDAEGCGFYARLAQLLAEREGLRPFDVGAMRELVRFGCRLVADRRRLSADFSHIAGLMREANHFCLRAGESVVRAEHVRQSLEERVYRSNWFAEQTLELIRNGTLLIRTSGQAVGEVNSLTVLSVGDYSFGRPARLTASAWVGQTGVINIERESRLSGSTHDKGMLIMEGYLRGKYAQGGPIGLGASMAFEQSYSGIDGDSASAAELFCLVSALSGLPLRQDLGVTGSVNQHGQIQAIGGVNEKIEGFFDLCRAGGLTGNQGVCFPRANVPNLVLRPDVVEAVRQGQFHLWPLDTLDQGLELLTGLRAGDVHDGESVHGKVAARFRQISEAMRQTPPTPLERSASVPPPAPPPPPTPPELPPHG